MKQKNIHQTVAFVVLSLILVTFFTTACRAKKDYTVSSEAKHYHLKGTAVAIKKKAHEVVISHEAIEDYMDGMTMPFKVRDDWVFSQIKPGDLIDAVLVIDDNRSWLQDVVVSQPASGETPNLPVEDDYSESIGKEIPSIELVNQDGKTARLKDLRGQAVLLTFIYTRCPLPDYCPLMSDNFSRIEQELRNRPELFEKTHLLSISIDPDYDKPEKLRSYGAAYVLRNSNRPDFSHWEFVTGKPDDLRKLGDFLGLTYFTQQDQIVHSLRTAIIGTEGKLIKVYSGNEWKPSEVITEVEAIVKAASNQRSATDHSDSHP
ncbi:MAG: SCO family protein [Pyrinomonadaceae bacterium]